MGPGPFFPHTFSPSPARLTVLRGVRRSEGPQADGRGVARCPAEEDEGRCPDSAAAALRGETSPRAGVVCCIWLRCLISTDTDVSERTMRSGPPAQRHDPPVAKYDMLFRMSAKDNGRNKPRPEPDEPEELTVVVMRFRGSGETIRRGFDTVSQALNALAPPVQVLPPSRPARKLAPASSNSTEAMEPAEVEEGTYENADLVDAEEAPATEEKKSVPRERKPPRIPELNNKLDLNTATSLATYVKEKAPKTTSERFLVVAGWFKHHRNTDEISISDMFTCFHVMGWKDRPEDIGQHFRNLKSHQKWFGSGTGKGTYQLTITGLNPGR